MAASICGRPIRSLRMRGRNDSGEENVPLDLTREPNDNLREILQNVAKPHGITNMRKLDHLNNFTKLLNSISQFEEKFGFTYEEIIICLRLALLNEAKEVRAAGTSSETTMCCKRSSDCRWTTWSPGALTSSRAMRGRGLRPSGWSER